MNYSRGKKATAEAVASGFEFTSSAKKEAVSSGGGGFSHSTKLMASPSSFSYLTPAGWMSSKSIVQIALNIRWLESQGVPDLRAIRIRLHYGPEARVG